MSKHKCLLVQQHQSHSHTIPKLANTSAVIFSYSFGTGGLFSSKRLVSSYSQQFFKIGVLKISREASVSESLFNKTGALFFQIEFCENFKNIIFTEHLRTTSSVFIEHICILKTPNFNSFLMKVFII